MGSYNIISAVDDFFNRWDQSTTTPMEDMWTTRGTMLKNKPNLVTFHESILVRLWTFQLTLIYIKNFNIDIVVVMPRTILPWRNRRCALSATGTWKPKEEKDAKCVTCFMEENEISLREVARFDKHKRDYVWSGKWQHLLMSDWWTSISSFCKLSELTSTQ